MCVLEMYQRSNRHYSSSSVSDQVDHLGDPLARSNDIIHQYAVYPLRIHVLTKMITTFVLLGPEDLIGIERLPDTERHRYTSGSGRNNRAIRKCRKHLGFTTKQPRKRNIQNPGVTVITHCQRHLKIVS